LRDFIYQFLASSSLLDGARDFISFIKPYTLDETILALDFVEHVINAAGTDLVDFRTSTALLEGDLGQITLMIYTHSSDPVEKIRAMDLFERLLAWGSHYALEALKDYDRR
jgi:hypothetical protein